MATAAKTAVTTATAKTTGLVTATAAEAKPL